MLTVFYSHITKYSHFCIRYRMGQTAGGWGRWQVKPAVIPNSSLYLCWIGAHFKRLRELKPLSLPCLEQDLNVLAEDLTTIISISLARRMWDKQSTDFSQLPSLAQKSGWM